MTNWRLDEIKHALRWERYVIRGRLPQSEFCEVLRLTKKWQERSKKKGRIKECDSNQDVIGTCLPKGKLYEKLIRKIDWELVNID